MHQLTPEQIETLCEREKLTFDDFSPEKFEEERDIKVSLLQFRNIDDLLYQLREQKGSDLHINVGLPPMLRVNGDLMRTSLPPLSEDRCQTLLLSILGEELKARFSENWEIDFSYQIKNIGRFRVNIFKQRNGLSGVFRMIPAVIPTYEDLGLERKVFEGLTEFRNGLILVTGPTGHGKSTTMAVMVDSINKSRYEHILTIEDPIEFVHQHKRCSINQRELGMQTKSFSAALRSALREDPDVILVGEMRDPETIKLALTASETGHLVFSTLHTINSYESINRIIGAFPADQQDQIRIELSGTLRAIISQKLLPRADRRGRALAYELLMCNTAVKNLIKEAKTEQILSIMQTSQGDQMQTMDQSLAKLINKGICTYDTALPHASDKKTLNNLLKPQGSSTTDSGLKTGSSQTAGGTATASGKTPQTPQTGQTGQTTTMQQGQTPQSGQVGKPGQIQSGQVKQPVQTIKK
ncbi:MAG: type IV pilus twitching motility protein PilT [Candidatus Riflebacteria bacterium]|nr:type IV pilus twitching motility protein PilT [Candidatus Riflebacteria bacterium]